MVGLRVLTSLAILEFDAQEGCDRCLASIRLLSFEELISETFLPTKLGTVVSSNEIEPQLYQKMCFVQGFHGWMLHATYAAEGSACVFCVCVMQKTTPDKKNSLLRIIRG
jgi:branched-subunit amino acid aminotransferase/4-amino-4-deoxychorismate lyase